MDTVWLVRYYRGYDDCYGCNVFRTEEAARKDADRYEHSEDATGDEYADVQEMTILG